jgi:hypothetical protein
MFSTAADGDAGEAVAGPVMRAVPVKNRAVNISLGLKDTYTSNN